MNPDIGTISQAEPARVPVSANAALAKENVFRVSEVDLPELPDGYSASTKCTAYWEEKIYAVMEIREWGKRQ